jgi:hypothetical protein
MKPESRWAAAGLLLCIAAVFATAWPVLKNPRLEADDYRYLHHIQQWQAGRLDALEAMTVENRWDHLWFMQEEGRIRFFRPTVVLSYALDRAVWGDQVAFGLTLTNVLIHLACSLLVLRLMMRLLGRGPPAVAAALLFAGLAAHSECIWYIAGRTDSLAAFGFLSAFALHLSGRRWRAIPFFIFALLTKELAVAAPVVFAAHDFWVARRRPDWRLYAVYGAVAAGVLILKKAALCGEGSDFVVPYLVSPLSSGFLNHLWLQFRSYSGNLFGAEVTVPFADAQTVAALHHPAVLIGGWGLLGTAMWLLRRDRRLWLLLLLGVLTWLPTSFVYLSERYLYLPSVAYVGILGLAACRLPKAGGRLSILLAAFAVFQSVKLYERHAGIAQQPGSVREMLRQIEPLHAQIQDDERLLLVNTPGLFVRAQFMQEILRVAFCNPSLDVDVLTMMPGQNGTEWKPGDPLPVMGAGVQVRQASGRELTLSGRSGTIVQQPGLKAFSWVPLDAGTYRTSSLEAQILSGSTRGASEIEFRFAEPLTNCAVLVWQADCSDLTLHPWTRRERAAVKLLRLE